jgi:hypothetical protein
LKRVFGLVVILLFLDPVRAHENCPVEVKLILASPAPQPVIAALGFEKKGTEGLVYFFDTESLDLLRQGVIMRIRQGANNDLTVKLRLPKGNPADDRSQLREQFPCEIDRTRAAAYTSYSVGRQLESAKLPQTGTDVHGLLSASQLKLLTEARVSIDWSRVIRIANIKLTKWQTQAQSPHGKLALELWEWPGGKTLELSAKAPPAHDVSRYAELEALMKMNGLPLNANQDTKTTSVLEALTRKQR